MDRDTLLPLSISAVLAVALHVSAFCWPGLTTANAHPLAVDPRVPKQPQAQPLLPKPPVPPTPQPKPEPKPKPPEPEPKPETKPKVESKPDAAAKPPKPLEIGRDGEPVRATIAWIPYDDFKKLMAQQSLTIQPALQKQVDAVADAPIEMNPSTPSPTPATVLVPSSTNQQAQAEQPEQTAQTKQPDAAQRTPATPATPVAPPTPVATAMPPAQPRQPQASASDVEPLTTPPPAKSGKLDLPPGQGAPPLVADASHAAAASQKPATADSHSEKETSPSQDDKRLALAPAKLPPAMATPDTTPDAQESPARTQAAPPAKPAKPAAPAVVESKSNEARPTSVPRSDRESVATQTTPMPDHVVLGRVLVSDGIEIKTTRPRFNISTLFTASPRNPVATIVFDKTGQVVRAELILSSGFADIDSPILNSLYEWRASGKKLQNLKSDTFTLYQMKLLLVPERKSDETSSDDSADQSESSSRPDAPASPDTPPNE